MSPLGVTVQRLSALDIRPMRAVLGLFGDVFDMAETYCGNPPDEAYWRGLLSDRHFIAIAAMDGSEIVGALTAYILPKYEQARSEVYIYDLAVAERYRRRGIATAMINAVKPIARTAGAHVMFIQADVGDAAPIALYSKLGTREDVVHFDIPVEDP